MAGFLVARLVPPRILQKIPASALHSLTQEGPAIVHGMPIWYLVFLRRSLQIPHLCGYTVEAFEDHKSKRDREMSTLLCPSCMVELKIAERQEVEIDFPN